MVTSTHNMVFSDSVKEDLQILVVDAELTTRLLLLLCLTHEGYRVTALGSGQEALNAFADSPFDMVVLDLNLPILDGWTLCAELRKRSDVPIVIVTSNSQTDHMNRALTLGADCYIIKPFSLKEIRARIHAILRRASQKHKSKSSELLGRCGILLDEDTHKVSIRDRQSYLGPCEFRLLKYFLHNPDRPISKEELLAQVWDYQYQPCEDFNFIRVAVTRLRSKIEEDASLPKYIKTVQNHGYQFYTGSKSI